MKVIIAGSREISNLKWIEIAVEQSEFDITEVVSGGARGVDHLGETYARNNGIPIKQFIPDWDGLGKRAGYVRNKQMAEYADALIAIWDGESKGTGHMINIANDLGLKVYVLTPKSDI